MDGLCLETGCEYWTLGEWISCWVMLRYLWALGSFKVIHVSTVVCFPLATCTWVVKEEVGRWLQQRLRSSDWNSSSLFPCYSLQLFSALFFLTMGRIATPIFRDCCEDEGCKGLSPASWAEWAKWLAAGITMMIFIIITVIGMINTASECPKELNLLFKLILFYF